MYGGFLLEVHVVGAYMAGKLHIFETKPPCGAYFRKDMVIELTVSASSECIVQCSHCPMMASLTVIVRNYNRAHPPFKISAYAPCS